MHSGSNSATHKSPLRHRGSGLLILSILFFVFTLLPGYLAADTRLPGVVDRPPETPPALDDGSPGELPPVPPPERPAEDAADAPRASFISIGFKGMSVVSEHELAALASSYLKRPLSSADVAQLKFEITRYYFERGYVLVKVTTPPQDISAGHLDIVIHEARVGRLRVQHDGHLRDRVADALARTLDADAVFHEGDIESLANDYNELSGLRAALTLHKGEAPGTTDLSMRLTPVDEDVQQFTLDNYGSDLTGNWVGALRLQTSNTLRLGETLGMQLRMSDGDLWSVGIDARSPIGIRNLWWQFEYGYSENEIGDSLAFLDASGTSQRARLMVSGTLINTRVRKLSLRSGLEMRTHKSDLANTTESHDQLRQWLVEGSYLIRQDTWTGYGAVTVSKGLDIFDASARGDALASRSQGEPMAWRLQPLLYGVVKLGEDSHIKALVTGQLATHTLLSSDLFALGGYGSVRGFQAAAITGEAGAQYSLEYGRRLGAWSSAEWTAGVFTDGGRVWNRESDSVTDDVLFSAGLTMEAVLRAQTLHSTRVRIDVAAPLGEYSSPDVDDYQVLLRLTQSF